MTALSSIVYLKGPQHSGVVVTAKLTPARVKERATEWPTEMGLIVRPDANSKTARNMAWSDLVLELEPALAVCADMRNDLRAMLDRLDAEAARG